MVMKAVAWVDDEARTRTQDNGYISDKLVYNRYITRILKDDTVDYSYFP